MKTDPRFPRLHIVDHPLVQHKLSIMRQKETSTNISYDIIKSYHLQMRIRMAGILSVYGLHSFIGITLN